MARPSLKKKKERKKNYFGDMVVNRLVGLDPRHRS
jgi:hypothetical protein